MAGQNHIPRTSLNHRRDLDDSRLIQPHRRLPSTDIHLIEDRIAAQSREIQTLLHDNQRIATTHVALKEDFKAAQQEVRRLADKVASVKAERDARVREVYDRSLKLEAEARSVVVLSAELDRVRTDIKDLRAERKELTEKLTDIDGEIARSRLRLQQQMPDLTAEIEATRREIQRGKAAIEYERQMHASNFGLSEAMEKHMISLAREAEELRVQLTDAEKRFAMAAAAANPAGPVYASNAIHHQQMNLEGGAGYGGIGNPVIVQNYAVHQYPNPYYGQYGPST